MIIMKFKQSYFFSAFFFTLLHFSKEDPNFAWDETRGRFMWSESSMMPNPELPPVQEGDAELDEDEIGDLDEPEEDDDAEENV